MLPSLWQRAFVPLRSRQWLQCWRCIACGRSYNALTGTTLARLRKKECCIPYFQCLLDSRTVRASAETVQVHRTTSFRWRHRMLSGFMLTRTAPIPIPRA